MAELSFERFCDFIRDFACLRRNVRIMPETLFERHLGITGDDGCELLVATERQFGIRLHTEREGYRGTFHLGPNEFLFESEGAFPHLFARLLGRPYTVHKFTVGELHAAVQNALRHK